LLLARVASMEGEPGTAPHLTERGAAPGKSDEFVRGLGRALYLSPRIKADRRTAAQPKA
jgi:hypothetical protein